jgi:hypothetical protein
MKNEDEFTLMDEKELFKSIDYAVSAPPNE